jgi:hypothetical protein
MYAFRVDLEYVVMTFFAWDTTHGFIRRFGSNSMETVAVRAYRGLEVALTYQLIMYALTNSFVLVRVTFVAGRGYCDRVLPVAIELLDRVRRLGVFRMAV